ncbi:hypothetical protein [Nitratireductor pacificus]|uniref:Secreted protein n=1 Tax=Nitratireductor pacificus pht-3B TaxID=391937 RepID=K2MU66_9HYPH|nr:hypothetical protein [Nitratireductor pacificus]EKF20952.1 hypothetical protein NA2_01200 [Nitratireductor pacificus pht-3B]
MRKIYCQAAVLISTPALFLFSGSALATNNYIINQNQTGISLPGVSAPGGFDEVRASDGTTCRAAMGGSGAYVDSGVIGSGLNSGSQSLSAYGRLVVPLGTRPTRLDCDRLYQLELRRLELEVKMLESGLGAPSAGRSTDNQEWAQGAGWTSEGRQ